MSTFTVQPAQPDTAGYYHLRHLAEQGAGWQPGPYAADRPALYKILQQQPPDVVVMESRFEGKCTAALLRSIKEQYPHLPVLVLSRYEKPWQVECMQRAGASGYLVLPLAAAEFSAAVHKLAAGGQYHSARLDEIINNIKRNRWVHDLVDERDVKIIRGLAFGLGDEELAPLVHMTASSVKSYRHHKLPEKLGFKDPRRIILFALKYGLVLEEEFGEMIDWNRGKRWR